MRKAHVTVSADGAFFVHPTIIKLDPAVMRAICADIGQATGEAFALDHVVDMAGGCINRAVTLAAGARRYFVKMNAPSARDMFDAEAAGLRELAGAHAIRVPEPLCADVAGGVAYLVLEHLELRGSPDARQLGLQLAALHRKQGDAHGWFRANTLGATPQVNTTNADWSEFWRERRLCPQLELAYNNGFSHLREAGDRLLVRVPELLAGHQPVPSLLHGDLWGGNVGALADKTPVLFDPAVYYGDRETDLAMSELFGGFPSAFYAAYHEAWPLEAGYAERKHLYNLYHLLNHLNLFGESYLSRVRSCMARLV